MRRAYLATATLILVLAHDLVRAEDGPLVGNWRLKSFVREVGEAGTGSSDRYDQMGAHPDGYINYSPDGRMFVFFVSADQPRPTGDVPTDPERILLHKSMLAYGGSYLVDGPMVIHHVDIAWNGARLGSDQVRYFTISGNMLTLKTAPNKSPVDGREGVGVLVFEKVK
jgi:Lipocalin-like domain